MRYTSEDSDRKVYRNGFSLIEIILVIAIIYILALVVVPSLVSYVERAKKEVCYANCLQLERMY